ncbi:BnaC06g41460D [Brassica napus]|uniref:BnaC06g41460D protein n=1 Tax=Brassica napus TaxID=3708 RepID=A0A078J994_BRANA|nr:BnaC06g41460D [Brassica napus]
MGCAGSTQWQAEGPVKKIRKPKPFRTLLLTMAVRKRYGMHFVLLLKLTYLLRKQSWTGAGVIAQNNDLTICYDERGAKYERTKYVLSEPTNLVEES